MGALPERTNGPSHTLIQGRYAVSERLADGSRWTRYAAVDRTSDREVLVHVARPTMLHNEATLARFERRMKASRRIQHPVLVPPEDSGEQFDGSYYVVSARPPGQPLDRVLAQQPDRRLAWVDAHPLLLDLVRGMGAAHARRVVHGALHPTACWVALEPTPSLRVLELGADTRPTKDDEDLAGSKTTALSGDATYMSPESITGVLGDARSDLYLVGLLAYRMLAGRPPFVGANGFKLASMHLQASVPPFEDAGVEPPEAVKSWVFSLLSKDPQRRPASMDEAEDTLVKLAPLREGPPTLAAEPQMRRGRGRGRGGRSARATVGRHDALRKLEANGAPAPGRRLPGHELVDADAPFRSTPARPVRSRPAPPPRPRPPVELESVTAQRPQVSPPPRAEAPSRPPAIAPTLGAKAPRFDPTAHPHAQPPPNTPPTADEAVDELGRTLAFSRAEFEAARDNARPAVTSLTPRPSAASSLMDGTIALPGAELGRAHSGPDTTRVASTSADEDTRLHGNAVTHPDTQWSPQGSPPEATAVLSAVANVDLHASEAGDSDRPDRTIAMSATELMAREGHPPVPSVGATVKVDGSMFRRQLHAASASSPAARQVVAQVDRRESAGPFPPAALDAGALHSSPPGPYTSSLTAPPQAVGSREVVGPVLPPPAHRPRLGVLLWIGLVVVVGIAGAWLEHVLRQG